MSKSVLSTSIRAALTHFAITLGGVAAAVGSRKIFQTLNLPDVLVVRKIDYNHYPIERASMIGEFAIALVLCWGGGYLRKLPSAGKEILAVIASSWLQVAIMELCLQALGARTMDLVAFSERAPGVVVALLDAFDALGAPILVRKVLAVLWQTFLEGALYFGRTFIIASIWRAGGRVLPLAFLVWTSAFRTFVSFSNGWPQPIVIGSEAVGKRQMLSTLPFRIPQLLCTFYIMRNPKTRAIWWPLPAFQLVGLGFYFFMLRAVGRSYLELEWPTTSGEAKVVEALPLAADLFLTLFRVAEPLMGAATATYVALQGLERLQPTKAAAGKAE